MSLFLCATILAVIAACSISEASSDSRCGQQSVFRSCGSACVPTCSNGGKPSRICTQQCVRGCFCKRGYVKADDGNCVRLRQCDAKPPVQQQCGQNSVYQACGSACVGTCKNGGTPPAACTRQCVNGCFCNRGYVKNDAGQCVSLRNCEAPPNTQCGNRAKYQACGTACEPTCLNGGKPSQICTNQCVSGCFCNRGYVKNSNGQCVRLRKCGTPPNANCGNHAKYQACGTACEATCKNGGRPSQICTAQCVPGCFCNRGYVKTDNGACVRPNQCGASPDNRCGKRATYESCGSACVATCKNGGVPSRICTKQCVSGCFCKQGFVKNGNDKCVRLRQCGIQSCKGQNQVFKQCGTACPVTCANRKRQPQPCTANCVQGCFCRPGYIQRARNGPCVRPNRCPR